MEPGRVSAETRRFCVGLAVTGSLLVMAGVMLGFAAQAVTLGMPGAGSASLGLIAGGMFCGVILIAASATPPARGGRGRRRGRPGRRGAGPA